MLELQAAEREHMRFLLTERYEMPPEHVACMWMFRKSCLVPVEKRGNRKVKFHELTYQMLTMLEVFRRELLDRDTRAEQEYMTSDSSDEDETDD